MKVRILSFVRAEKIINDLRYYATVQSTSRPDKLNHTVGVYREDGSHKFTYKCTCEGNSLGQSDCIHIQAIRRKVIGR